MTLVAIGAQVLEEAAGLYEAFVRHCMFEYVYDKTPGEEFAVDWLKMVVTSRWNGARMRIMHIAML